MTRFMGKIFKNNYENTETFNQNFIYFFQFPTMFGLIEIFVN